MARLETSFVPLNVSVKIGMNKSTIWNGDYLLHLNGGDSTSYNENTAAQVLMRENA